MFRIRWARARRAWTDQRGVSDYVELALALPLVLAAFVGGSVVVQAVGAESALHTVAGLADRSLVANGCITQAAVQGMTQTLQAAHINPAALALTTQGASGAQPASYGQTGLGVQLQYPMPIRLPFVGQVGTATLTAQVAGDQSQAVAYGSSPSACASSATLASFSGSGGGGATQLPALPTAITVAASPNPVVQGNAVTVRGTVSNGSGPMAGVTVQIAAGGQTLTATTNAQGQYATAWTPPAAGQVTVTASAGPVAQSATLTVEAPAPAQVQLAAPSPVAVGQPFTITGTVLTAAGQAVADGTSVTVASSDPQAFPTLSATTQHGTFSVSEPAFTRLSPASVTFTATAQNAAGSAAGQITVSVAPGAPQSVTLAVSPQSGAAGSAFTVSGTVLGPDGTPVAAGTPVTIASPNDAQDPMPTLQTNAQGQFSGTVTLTLAGSVQLQATAGSVQSAPATVTVTPGHPATAVGLQAQPNPVNQGATTTIQGTVADAFGNPVTAGIPITLAAPAWSQPVTATTAAGGTFQVPVVFHQAGTQTVSVSWQGTLLGSLAVRVNQLGAYQITASQGSTTLTAGQAGSVTFTLTDSQGQPVAGDTLTFSASPSTATLSATAGVTNAQGQVTLTVADPQSGTLTVTASLAQDNGATTGTATWTVQPAAPAAADPPAISPSVAQSTQTGGTVDPVITGEAVDAYGNPIPGAQVTVTGGWDPGVNFTGTTNGQGYFQIPLTPVQIGGPYYPTITITDATGSNTQTYTDTSLTVVRQLYTLTLAATNGQASTPAGTPYGIVATLTEYGANSSIPVPNAAITFTVTSSDTATTWAAGGATPTPTGPTTITVTTDQNGQATVEAAFEPNLGAQTVQATFATDNTTGTLNVTVTAVPATAAVWEQLTPNPATAGQTVQMAVQGLDSYGFPVANGEAAQYSFDYAGPWSGTTGSWNGLTGVVAGSFTVTKAGSYPGWITIAGGPQLYSPNLTVNPGPLEYFYPVLGPANNTSGTWLSGNSWTNWASPSQGPTNAYGTLADPPTGGSPYSVAGFGVDAYGNQIPGATATLSCVAANGGSCLGIPGTAGSGWQNVGPFIGGSYTLTYMPASSPTGIAGNAETTYDTFTVPGLRFWDVEVGNGSTVLATGSGTINLGTLPNNGNQLNFAIEGVDANGNVFQGYTNNGTGREDVFCVSATNGGVCPNGLGNPIGNPVPLGSSGTPNGYTGWSNLTTFAPGTYTLEIRAGEYGDAGGQNWTPTWYNTDVTFNVNAGPVITGVSVSGSGWNSTYTVTGYNFGSYVVGYNWCTYQQSWGYMATELCPALPNNNVDTPWAQLVDHTQNWSAGYTNDSMNVQSTNHLTFYLESWTPTQIVFTFSPVWNSGQPQSVYSGDSMQINVWNPQTGLSASYWFTQP